MDQSQLIEKAILVAGKEKVLQSLSIDPSMLAKYRSGKHEMKYSRIFKILEIINTYQPRCHTGVQLFNSKDADTLPPNFIRAELIGCDNSLLYIFLDIENAGYIVGILFGESDCEAFIQLEKARINSNIRESKLIKIDLNDHFTIQALELPDRKNIPLQLLENIVGQKLNFPLHQIISPDNKQRYKDLFHTMMCTCLASLLRSAGTALKITPDQEQNQLPTSLEPVMVQVEGTVASIVNSHQDELSSLGKLPTRAEYFLSFDSISSFYIGIGKFEIVKYRENNKLLIPICTLVRDLPKIAFVKSEIPPEIFNEQETAEIEVLSCHIVRSYFQHQRCS